MRVAVERRFSRFLSLRFLLRLVSFFKFCGFRGSSKVVAEDSGSRLLKTPLQLLGSKSFFWLSSDN